MAVAHCAPTSPFRYSLSLSRTIRSRFSLFTHARLLFPTFFSASLRNRPAASLKHWLRAFKFLVWLGTSRGYPIRFTHSFRSPPSFSLRPLPMTRNRRSLGIHHLSFALPGAQHPPSFLKRSILFSPLVVLHTPSPSLPSLLLPRKSSSPLSVLHSSLILSHPPFSGLLSSRFFLSAPPTFFHLPRRLLAATRRWQRARKSFSRIALRKMFAFFPNHNLSDVLFATDVSIMDI